MLRLSLLHSKPYLHLHSKVNSKAFLAPNCSLLTRPTISVAKDSWRIHPSSLTIALVSPPLLCGSTTRLEPKPCFAFLGQLFSDSGSKRPLESVWSNTTTMYTQSN